MTAEPTFRFSELTDGDIRFLLTMGQQRTDPVAFWQPLAEACRSALAQRSDGGIDCVEFKLPGGLSRADWKLVADELALLIHRVGRSRPEHFWIFLRGIAEAAEERSWLASQN